MSRVFSLQDIRQGKHEHNDDIPDRAVEVDIRPIICECHFPTHRRMGGCNHPNCPSIPPGASCD